MKNLLKVIIILTIFLLPRSFGQNELKDVGVAKWAVLEITTDYAPVRVAPNVDAPRFCHLREGIVIYADKKNDEFYRIDFGTGKYFWIEKKYVEPQAIINKKMLAQTDKIVFKESKQNYIAKITEKEIQGGYQTIENIDGLRVNFFDVNFNPVTIQIENRPASFQVKNGGNNSFFISYINKKPIVGYGVVRDKDSLVLNIKKMPKINNRRPLKKMRIAVDPGHGGSELGVTVKKPDGSVFMEKNINLKVSKYLRRELKRSGAKVTMTRKNDKELGLYERVEFAKTEKADFFISIHQNSLPKGQDVNKKHGAGVYYYNNMAKPMAEKIQTELVKATGFRDDGVNLGSFAVIRQTEMPAVLVECGYLIYPPELEKLTNKKFQKKIAKSVKVGMESYLRELKAADK